jgi:L-threonylcarbamoyladenylate synthase
MAVTSDPVGEAIAATRRGELVVMPTDTVYGIGTRPDDPDATARVFEAKLRDRDLELPVLVATIRDAERVGILDDRAERLAAGCWPGGLTLILLRARASRGWDLGGDPETVGVRIPHHPLALAVLAGAGPMAVSSANRSGEPPAIDCDALASTFGDLVSVYLCQEAPLSGAPSTVLDLAHGPARVVRPGAVGAERLTRLLGLDGPLLDSPPPP